MLDDAQLAALEESFRRGSISADEFARTLAASTKNVGQGAQTFSQQMGSAASALGSGFSGLTKSLANGQQGAAAFNTTIAGGSNALKSLIGNSDLFGGSIKALGEGAAGYVMKVNAQSDALFNTFQNLSKVGGAGVDGMQGVFDSMQKFGMTMNQLPEFGNMIAQNSEALAKLGGTVTQGVKTFAGVASGIQQSGLQAQFERMGITIQAQNEGTANYLRLQAMNGASSTKTQAQLTAGAEEYIRQQDRLSKLTGKSADTLAKEEEARMSDQRYRAVTVELEMKAAAARAAGDEATAQAAENQIAQNRALLDQTPAALKQGVQDLMSGFVNSPEAQKMYISLPQMSQAIIGQNFEASKLMTDAQKEASAAVPRMIGGAKAGINDATQAAFAGVVEISAKGRAMTATEADKAAKEAQDRLAAGTDLDINNQVAMREAQRATTTALDNLTELGVRPVTAAMATLSTGIESFVTKLPGTGEKTATEKKQQGKYAPAEAGYALGKTGKFFDTELIKKSGLEGKDPTEVLKETWGKLTDINLYKNLSMNSMNSMNTRTTGANPVNTTTGRSLFPSFGNAQSSVNMQAMQGFNQTQTSVAELLALTEQETRRVIDRRPAGPSEQTPTRVEDNRPEREQAAFVNAPDPAVMTSSITQGFGQLSSAIMQNTSSLDELVDLMRRSVGVQGRILQQSRN